MVDLLRRPGAMICTLFLLGAVACVTWAGDRYKALAHDEIVALSSATDSSPLSPVRCAAHKSAALALRDSEDGQSWSLNAPFFAGQHVDELASRHDRMGSICYEMAERDADRGVSTETRAQLRADWIRAWQNGRALLGGPEED